ncbi:MAG: hypothetical protein JTT17_07685 [Candidatus Brockarchaeota archaeon]|nr:hypothetical protein [Candidatus Brockarchaeota archaeon]
MLEKALGQVKVDPDWDLPGWIYYGDVSLPESWGVSNMIVLVIRCDNWILGDTITIRAL